jgi:aminoglycoside phosphotransferase (APT) family kinase protein
VARDVAGLTPEWFTRALARSEFFGTVTDAQSEPIGIGQMGRSYRVTLSYSDDQPSGPPSVVVKMAGGGLEARQRVAEGYRNEVMFYSQIAATVDVSTPRCWYSAITDDGTDFTLLLEDLHPARPGVQIESCSLDQAEDAVANLAALHAPRWNDGALPEMKGMGLADPASAQFVGEIFATAVDEFIVRFDSLGDEDTDTLHRCAEAISSWLLTRPIPYAVVHGDYRLDNLMFPPTGRGVSALDWQTVGVAPPGRDLGYFLGTALRPEDRRRSEGDLVSLYFDELRRRGVQEYSARECFDDYRLGQLQGPFITILGCIYGATAERTPDADEMFLSMAKRSCAAIRELESLSLVQHT